MAQGNVHLDTKKWTEKEIYDFVLRQAAQTKISEPVTPGFYINDKRVADLTGVIMNENSRKKLAKPITLESVIALAANAHRGQKDLGGAPYILHPLRVMLQVKPHSEMLMMAAVLHDVVEDTDWTLEKLRDIGIPLNVIHLLGFLTRLKKQETYKEYIVRMLNQSPTACIVKIADLRDNLNLDRLPLEKIDKYKSLIKRDRKALAVLLGNDFYE